MQISAGQDGIQRLLKAEQEAQSIVTAARKGEADLKQALHLKVQGSCCEHSAVPHCKQGDAIIKVVLHRTDLCELSESSLEMPS